MAATVAPSLVDASGGLKRLGLARSTIGFRHRARGWDSSRQIQADLDQLADSHGIAGAQLGATSGVEGQEPGGYNPVGCSTDGGRFRMPARNLTYAELVWSEQADGSVISETNPVGPVRVWPRGPRWAVTFAESNIHSHTYSSRDEAMAAAQARHGHWRTIG